MFTRVKVSAEEEINRSVYASVVRLRTEKGNKKKNVYDARIVLRGTTFICTLTFSSPRFTI